MATKDPEELKAINDAWTKEQEILQTKYKTSIEVLDTNLGLFNTALEKAYFNIKESCLFFTCIHFPFIKFLSCL